MTTKPPSESEAHAADEQAIERQRQALSNQGAQGRQAEADTRDADDSGPDQHD